MLKLTNAWAYYLRTEQQSGVRFLSQAFAFLTGHSVARYVRSPAPLTPLPRFTVSKEPIDEKSAEP